MASNTVLQIRNIATQSTHVPASTAEAQAVLGVLLGSLYGLFRAFDLGYEDRTGEALPATYQDELYGLLSQIAAGNPPRDGQWLAGFYFNSALHRLAALYHRCLKMLLQTNERYAPALAEEAVRRGLITQAQISALATVHKEVNKIKHDAFGVLPGREVDQDLVIVAADQALVLLRLAVARVRAPSGAG